MYLCNGVVVIAFSTCRLHRGLRYSSCGRAAELGGQRVGGINAPDAGGQSALPAGADQCKRAAIVALLYTSRISEGVGVGVGEKSTM